MWGMDMDMRRCGEGVGEPKGTYVSGGMRDAGDDLGDCTAKIP